MSIILWIILALIVFSAIVFFHELGHFMAARQAGVKVEEFGLGIPPKAAVLGKDSYGTQYTLNWLPIGGFVRLKWEDGTEDQTSPDGFASKGYFPKARILLAGVTMNFVLAWCIFFGLFWNGTNPEGIAPIAINTKFKTETESLLVPTYAQAKQAGIFRVNGIRLEPMEHSPAAKAGIKPGDVAIAINGVPTNSATDLGEILRSGPDSIVLKVDRNGEQSEFRVIPENGKIGAYISDNIVDFNTRFTYSYGFVDALKWATRETYGQSVLTFELLGNLLRKLVTPKTPDERTEATKSLSWPIGIGNVFVDLVSVHVPVGVVLAIAALISINLGVFNLLPFPALDGGRFAFLTIHTIISWISKGRFGTTWIESHANLVGFAVLILASVFVAYQDILRIMAG